MKYYTFICTPIFKDGLLYQYNFSLFADLLKVI